MRMLAASLMKPFTDDMIVFDCNRDEKVSMEESCRVTLRVSFPLKAEGGPRGLSDDRISRDMPLLPSHLRSLLLFNFCNFFLHAAAMAAPMTLLADIETKTPGSVLARDTNLITFIEPFDAQNPLQWTFRKKWLTTSVMSATAFIRITSSTIMAPALDTISADLHMNSIESSMALSVYLLASAFGPLVLAPLSEMYGRQRVLHVSNTWFLVWNLICGFAATKGLLIASRALAGFGGSVAYAVCRLLHISIDLADFFSWEALYSGMFGAPKSAANPWACICWFPSSEPPLAQPWVAILRSTLHGHG